MINEKCPHYSLQYCSDRYLYDACTITHDGFDHKTCDINNCPLNHDEKC